MVVQIEVRGMQRFAKRLNKVRKLPSNMNDVNFQWLKLVQRNLRLQLTRNKTRWRGKLWNSIQARRMSKNRSILVMAKYGTYLDRMKPHFVKLKRGRLIRKWAQEKGNVQVRRIAKREGSIFVRPHPFFDVAYNRSLIKLRPMLRKHIRLNLGG